jgi:hypothetical protein
MSFGALERSMSIAPTDDALGKVYGTAFYPMLSDQIGENKDILFMKNLSMTKSVMNFTVGIPGFMASNP